MANGQGWIRLHRQIWKNAVWDTDEPFDKRSAWIDLLLMANHEDRQILDQKGQPIVIHRGQRLISIRNLAERWHWNKDTVSRYLNTLKKLGMIQKHATASATLITIENYGFFQGGCDSKRDSDGDSGETVERTVMGTKQELNKELLKNERRNGDAISPWGGKPE